MLAESAEQGNLDPSGFEVDYASNLMGVSAATTVRMVPKPVYKPDHRSLSLN